MGTTDKGRIDDLKDTVSGIDKRLSKVEEKISETREDVLNGNALLKELIIEAVSKGNEKAFSLIGEIDERVCSLENAEARKALEDKRQNKKFIRDVVLGGIVTVCISWIVLGFLNNYASITSQAIRDNVVKEEVNTSENNNN